MSPDIGGFYYPVKQVQLWFSRVQLYSILAQLTRNYDNIYDCDNIGPFRASCKFSRESSTNEEKFVPLLNAKRKKLTVPSFENYYGKGTKKRRKTEKKRKRAEGTSEFILPSGCYSFIRFKGIRICIAAWQITFLFELLCCSNRQFRETY